MAKIYHAPKPRYSKWEWFKFIAVRVVFPPILLWDLLKFGINKLLGAWVSGIVLPAQNRDFTDLKINDDAASMLSENDLTCEKHEVITHDDAHLDTFEIKHMSQKDIAPQYQQYVINLVGNGMCYEHIIRDMKADAKAMQTNVVGFNLRGVGQSTGKAKSKDDLVTDTIAQVQRLLDQGVSPQNITLKGHSLGAGIASLVAYHFHQLEQPINVFDGSSFSSITNFLVGHVRLQRDEDGKARGHKDSLGGKILGWIIKPFVKLALALVNWEIDAGSAFKSIPEAYRDYMVVRSRKEIREKEGRIDDAVIPHYASIHKELASERRAKKAQMDKEIGSLESRIKNAASLAQSELIEKKEALVQAREEVKSARKMETLHPAFNGHQQYWSELHNRSGKSAQTFFRDFVQRAAKDHAVTSAPNL